MAKNLIDYQINFTANTETAKAELNKLVSVLKSIENLLFELVDKRDITNINLAVEAAKLLGIALNASTNVNTGRLDLSKFSDSLKKSKINIDDLLPKLSKAGQLGKEAFLGLAKSVSQSLMPLRTTSKMVQDLGLTLKNTVKWLLSSNLVHGLLSGLSGAIRYAKDLNTALTDIRIVTDLSTNDMSRFAESANKAAKSLSASTLDYAKASLIYFQQGDDQATVSEKTAITMKAANVSTESSTKEMSEYLTAVWNSYQAGAGELESFADIMATLGAKTATSMEEIAAAMQKVAAVGHSVGVGFDLMSSIIATVSSVTRQSAESIGTSFKTIFARIGDLKLGKTDEDGVGLGVVSTLVESLGFKILDTNGELRDMGTVVTEIGDKWLTMDKATQTALAQAIAGKRQYTQLVALFDNWDMFNLNMDYTKNSDGALQEMQDKYAESWEAASKRVQASLEAVYSKIINDKVIIDMTNLIGDAIDQVGELINAFGGIGQVLTTIGGIMLKTFSPQITLGLDNSLKNLSIKSGLEFKKFSEELSRIISEMQDSKIIENSPSSGIALDYYKKLTDLLQSLGASSKGRTEEEISGILSVIDKLHSEIDINIELLRIRDLSQKSMEIEQGRAVALLVTGDENADVGLSTFNSQKEKSEEWIKYIVEENENFEDITKKMPAAVKETELYTNAVRDVTEAFSEGSDSAISYFANQTKTSEKALNNILKLDKLKSLNTDKLIDDKTYLRQLKNLYSNNKDILENLNISFDGDKTKADLDEIANSIRKKIESIQKQSKVNIEVSSEALKTGGFSEDNLSKVSKASQSAGVTESNNLPEDPTDFYRRGSEELAALDLRTSIVTSSFTSLLAGTVQLTGGIATLAGAFGNLGDSSIPLTQKIIAISAGLLQTISGISAFLSNLGSIKGMYAAIDLSLKTHIGLKLKETAAKLGAATSTAAESVATGVNTAVTVGNTIAIKSNIIATKLLKKAQDALNATSPFGWVLIAIGALTTFLGILSSVSNAQAEANEKIAEAGEKSYLKVSDNSKKRLEESQKVAEAYAAWDKLKDSQIEGTKASDEYTSATNSVLKALDMEAYNVYLATGKYEDLSEAILDANEKRKASNVALAKSDWELAKQGLKGKALSLLSEENSTNFTSKIFERNGTQFIEILDGKTIADDEYMQKLAGGSKENVIELIKSFDMYGYGTLPNSKDYNVGNQGLAIDLNDPERIMKIAVKILEYEQQLSAEDKELWDKSSKMQELKYIVTTLAEPLFKSLVDLQKYGLETTIKKEQQSNPDESIENIIMSYIDGIKKNPELTSAALQEIINYLLTYMEEIFGLTPEQTSNILNSVANLLDSEIIDKAFVGLAENKRAGIREAYKNILIAQEEVDNSLNPEEYVENNKKLVAAEEGYLSAVRGEGYDRKRDEWLSSAENKISEESYLSSDTPTTGEVKEILNNIYGLVSEAGLIGKDSDDRKNFVFGMMQNILDKLGYDFTSFDEGLVSMPIGANKSSLEDAIKKAALDTLEMMDAKNGSAFIRHKIATDIQNNLNDVDTDNYDKFLRTEWDKKVSTKLLSTMRDLSEVSSLSLFRGMEEELLKSYVLKMHPELESNELDEKLREMLGQGYTNEDFSSERAAALTTFLASISADSLSISQLSEAYELVTGSALSAADALNLLTRSLGEDSVAQARREGNITTLKAAELSFKEFGDTSGLNQGLLDEVNRILGDGVPLTEGNIQKAIQDNLLKGILELYTDGKIITEYNALLATMKDGDKDGNYSGSWEGTLEESTIDVLKGIGITVSQNESGYIATGTEKQVAEATIAGTLFLDNSNNDKSTLLQNQLHSLDEMGNSFKNLQAIEQEFANGNVITAEAMAALGNSLDLTDFNIRSNYLAFQEAVLSGDVQAYESALDGLTTSIILGNGAMLENNVVTEQMLESWKDLYNITDDYGNALTVVAVNTMRANKANGGLIKSLKETKKALESSNKIVIIGNRSLRINTETYTEIAKAAKAANKSVGDFIDSSDGFKDFSDNEKEALKYGAEMSQVFTKLTEDLGSNLKSLPKDVQNAIETQNMDDLVKSLLSPDTFDSILESVGMGGKEVLKAIEDMSADSDAAIRKMGADLDAAADENGNIDLGILLSNMGVDVNNPIETLTALEMYIKQLAGVPYFKGTSAALEPIISALSAGIDLQNKYGVGGARNGPPPPPSGGGGGGGGKKTKKKFIKNTDEIERYHLISEVLTRTKAELDKIDKLKDRTYGGNHIKQLDDEIKKLKENITEQQKYRDEINSYLAQDKAMIQSHGAQLDQEGNIYNYKEMMQKWIDDYNAAIQKFNNSKQDEGDQLALDDSEEIFNQRKEDLELYEETLKLVEDEEQTFLDLQNKLSEAALEKITYAIEIKTEINEGDLAILEYFTKKYEDSLKDQGALMENLLNLASEYEDNLSAVTTAMAELNTQHMNGTLNDADYKEGMDLLRESALEYAEALLDIQKQLEETYENALSMATEEIANHTEKILGATDALASYIEIMGLLGRGANFGELTKFYEEQYKSNLANLNVQKLYLDSLLEQKKYFESKGSLSEAEKKQYEALQDTIRETHATVLENTQATLQSMLDAYNNSISAIFKDLDSAIAGTAGSIANLADQYGYYQEEQERYVSAAKELYEVSKLNRQIEDSIASATTSSSKQMLKALQERIKLQSESNDLSQYDIDMMNLQYKLALAKIALDEALDSKDIVRLTRDENGNFAYQYTADLSKVSEAQLNYEDTLQEINDLASGRISELEQSFLDAQLKYLESAQEIALDTTLTAEERALKLQLLQQRYNDTLLYIQEQYNNASSNLLTNQEVISDHYGQSLVNSTGLASTQINAQMQSMIENTQAYIDSLNEAINGEKGVNSTWQSYINNLAEVATALTGMDTGTAQERIEALYKALSSSAEEYAEANKAVSDAASGSIDIIEDSLNGVNDATEKWNEHAAALEIVILHYERLAQAAQAAILAAAGASASPASSPTPPTKYATGGLNTTTGLAWLDGTPSAPEMVLNPHDTLNILKAAKLSSNNSQMIDSIGAILSDLLSSMYSVLNSSYHTDIYRTGTTISELKQSVEIHAEFPNVQDRNEIEEAFDNLINRASQYVNLK